jgi:hypothetical protein
MEFWRFSRRIEIGKRTNANCECRLLTKVGYSEEQTHKAGDERGAARGIGGARRPLLYFS